jgi:hypothetical protein
MKTKLTFIAIMVSFLAALSVAEAGPIKKPDLKPKPRPKAPEISVSSGASALALLSGVMLLVSEGTRKRKV